MQTDSRTAGAPPGSAPPGGSARPSTCPQCGDPIIQTNLGGGRIDDYCENCGWPDENRPPVKQFCLSCGATHYKEICPECGSDAQDDL